MVPCSGVRSTVLRTPLHGNNAFTLLLTLLLTHVRTDNVIRGKGSSIAFLLSILAFATWKGVRQGILCGLRTRISRGQKVKNHFEASVEGPTRIASARDVDYDERAPQALSPANEAVGVIVPQQPYSRFRLGVGNETE
ncbi:hypothetical protein RHGRI_028750 [Rhododendron griersonianum]|uniref:Uncharacterized protein n=1 Tax=Rhododendron griersonianum TaxID=479676 RepID=A0AAV6IK71_9ERIC|nr:hypothetical protein RHGRI_028750 [Rhododendron griersonianum]